MQIIVSDSAKMETEWNEQRMELSNVVYIRVPPPSTPMFMLEWQDRGWRGGGYTVVANFLPGKCPLSCLWTVNNSHLSITITEVTLHLPGK